MVCTIEISDNNNFQAQSIINMLRAFAEDYDFIKIFEEKKYKDLSKEQEIELDKRYEYFLENPNVGKSWDEVKASL